MSILSNSSMQRKPLFLRVTSFPAKYSLTLVPLSNRENSQFLQVVPLVHLWKWLLRFLWGGNFHVCTYRCHTLGRSHARMSIEDLMRIESRVWKWSSTNQVSTLLNGHPIKLVFPGISLVISLAVKAPMRVRSEKHDNRTRVRSQW